MKEEGMRKARRVCSDERRRWWGGEQRHRAKTGSQYCVGVCLVSDGTLFSAATPFHLCTFSRKCIFFLSTLVVNRSRCACPFSDSFDVAH